MTPTAQILSDVESMRAGLPAMDLKFWSRLGDHHIGLIKRYGFENFKRTVNFEYGQWAVTGYRHPFARWVLRSLLSQGQVPWGALARFDHTDTSNTVWEARKELPSRRDLNSYATYCGLVWQLARACDRVGYMDLEEPELGNPLPVRLFGRRISQDLAIASLELNRIAQFKHPHKTARVLEIGAGYGRTAYAFCSRFPTTQYFIVDVPPALAISQNYLASVLGEDAVARWGQQDPLTHPRRLNFLLPDELSRIEDGFVDLALNLSSFDEMPSAISAGYLKQFDRVVNGFVYLNGYPVTSSRGDERLGLSEAAYPSRWNEVYSGPHPVASTFVEKLFEVRAPDNNR